MTGGEAHSRLLEGREKKDKESDEMIFLFSYRCRTMDLMSMTRLTRSDRVMAEM